MSLWSKIIGTIESAWQVGLGGPQWKNSGPTISGASSTSAAAQVVAFDARTYDDSTYANVRAADPVVDADLTTKRYVDERVNQLATVVQRLIEQLDANGIDLPLDLVDIIDQVINLGDNVVAPDN